MAIRNPFCRFSLRALLIAFAAVAVGLTVTLWLLREPTYPIQVVSSVTVSPRGDKVAFLVSRGDPRLFEMFESGDSSEIDFLELARTYTTRLWMSLRNGHHNAVETTTDVFPMSAPMAWAPDESRLAFVSAEKSEDLANNDHAALKDLDFAGDVISTIAPPIVKAPRYSPDGKFLGYVQDHRLIVEHMSSRERWMAPSKVVYSQWCWRLDKASVFYLRDPGEICEFNLNTKRERVLFRGRASFEDYPSYLVISPDGSQLGFLMLGWFRSIDLTSGMVQLLFRGCSGLDWTNDGICFLMGPNGDCRGTVRLMVYVPETGSLSTIATGDFSLPRWLGDGRILVRRGNAELWAYRVADGTLGRRSERWVHR